MVVQKDVFWKAGIITAIVFILGILLGSFMESSRIESIREEYKQMEVEWADTKLQTIYFQILDPKFCDIAIEENLNFADRVYEEGLKIECYENANKLNDKNELTYEKQRYTLFKIDFWLNSIYLKNKCKANYTNVVYFYLDKPSLVEKSKQETISLILRDLKNKYGQQMMLIPIPLDLDLVTVNVIKSTYHIDKFPTILIDEKSKLEDLPNINEIEKRIKNAIL
jgi:hypothetical protein